MSAILALSAAIDSRQTLHALAMGAIFLLMVYVALPGMNSIPLERHEAYVLQVAQEMVESGNYVVPRILGELRLKKPPLNYWLTAGVCRLSGVERVLPWHGRLVSFLAGLALLIAIAVAGTELFSREVGLLAAAMTACSHGFLKHIASADPEMLRYQNWTGTTLRSSRSLISHWSRKRPEKNNWPQKPSASQSACGARIIDWVSVASGACTLGDLVSLQNC